MEWACWWLFFWTGNWKKRIITKKTQKMMWPWTDKEIQQPLAMKANTHWWAVNKNTVAYWSQKNCIRHVLPPECSTQAPPLVWIFQNLFLLWTCVMWTNTLFRVDVWKQLWFASVSRIFLIVFCFTSVSKITIIMALFKTSIKVLYKKTIWSLTYPYGFKNIC